MNYHNQNSPPIQANNINEDSLDIDNQGFDPDLITPPGNGKELAQLMSQAGYSNDHIKAAQRGIDQERYQQPTGEEPPHDKKKLRLISMENVKQKSVKWLWPGRIPEGKVTMFGGEPGLGKSFITIDIAARVSTGEPWPDAPEEPMPEGSVIILSAEDGTEDTIAPRLSAAGANLSNIKFLEGTVTKGKNAFFSLEHDIQALGEALEEMRDVKLIIIDPVSAYLGKTDSYKNADVRGILSPLSEMANKHNVAIVMITHLNKSGHGSALNRFTGSIGFVAAARAAWFFAMEKDENGTVTRYMAPAKSNLGKMAKTLTFDIVDSVISNLETDQRACIAWSPTPLDIDANEVMERLTAKKEKPTELIKEIGDWLKELLSNGEMHVKDIEDLAKSNGYTMGSVRKAQKYISAEIKPKGVGTDRKNYWRLPTKHTTFKTSNFENVPTGEPLPPNLNDQY